jgi:hypothetical protein
MPRPRPLTSDEATRTLANRFGKRADSLRQFNTKFGARSKRVFLVWTRWDGLEPERGVDDEKVLHRVEILPTPRVSDLTAVSRRPFFAEGTLPDGGVRVDEISVYRFTEDMLKGLVVPGDPGSPGHPIAPRNKDQSITMPAGTDFFYEIVDDGRQGEGPAERQRFQLIGFPTRLETRVQFAVFLSRSSADTSRRGVSQMQDDDL